MTGARVWCLISPFHEGVQLEDAGVRGLSVNSGCASHWLNSWGKLLGFPKFWFSHL